MAGYEAGLKARHLFHALGAWPMIIGATVAVLRAKRGRKR